MLFLGVSSFVEDIKEVSHESHEIKTENKKKKEEKNSVIVGFFKNHYCLAFLVFMGALFIV